MLVLKAQGLGGSIIFIGSKNALAASPGASAYCTAKAAELHLARCLALELAPVGIRVNVVNPDAVLRGSRIWQGEWAEQRASQYKTTPDELESVYRERSLLKRSVYPEDIAEAVAFFASERSAKSTGNIVNVDAGNAAAFTRRSYQHEGGLMKRDGSVDPRDPGFIAGSNAPLHDDLAHDYEALGSQLQRRGTDIEQITTAVSRFGVAVPSWGVGTGGTRFARFPGPGEPRNVFEKLEDCACDPRAVRRNADGLAASAVGSDTRTSTRLKEHGSRVRSSALMPSTRTRSRTSVARRTPTSSAALRHTDAAVREQAVAHNLDCIRIGEALGSKALTLWIGDGANFPGPAAPGARLRALPGIGGAGSMPACRSTGGC